MPMLIVVLTALVALPGLILGAFTVRDWNPTYDPEYLRDTVHQGVIAFLKIGLLMLLVCVGAVAIAAGIVAHRDGSSMRFGVWFCAVLAWILGACFIVHWVRSRRRAATRIQAARSESAS